MSSLLGQTKTALNSPETDFIGFGHLMMTDKVIVSWFLRCKCSFSIALNQEQYILQHHT